MNSEVTAIEGGTLPSQGWASRDLFHWRLLLAGAVSIFLLGLDLPDKTRFYLLLIVLLVYLGSELYHARAILGRRILINPIVATSLVTFGIMLGISNLVYLFADDSFLEFLLGETPYYWMFRAMVYVLAAAIAMWTGYRSGVGNKIGGAIRRWPLWRRTLRTRYEPNWGFIVIALIISIASRLIQVSLGVFGYSSDIDMLRKWAGITQYLGVGADLGKLGLVGLSLAYFNRASEDRKLPIVLGILLVIETTFGFLSGFKSQVILPFLIVGGCFYCARGKFPKWFVLGTVLLVFLSYVVIEPYRITRHADPEYRGTDILHIGSALVENIGSEDIFSGVQEDLPVSVLMGFLNRMSNLPDAARSIQFKEETELPEDSPEFLKNLLMTPVHAVVPRLLWPSKPLQRVGSWYAITVREQPYTSETAFSMTPVGYLYFAGGVVAILLTFGVLGLLQRVIYESFRSAGGGGALVLMGYFLQFAIIESSIDTVFINIFRMLPMLLASQYFLYKRTAVPLFDLSGRNNSLES